MVVKVELRQRSFRDLHRNLAKITWLDIKVNKGIPLVYIDLTSTLYLAIMMSELDPQSILWPIQLNSYTSVAMATIISYDYILTLPKEIEYVWNRPWTLMSTVFFVIRYCGLPVAMIQAFGGSSLWFGSDIVRTVLYELLAWGYVVFIFVTDLVMILRVYAMYNRSRITVGLLLLVYVPATTIQLVSTAIINNPKTNLSVREGEVFDVKLCVVSHSDGTALLTYVNVSRTLMNVVLCFFVIARFIRHSLEMHKLLGKWQSNRYMKLLVQESIFYFVINLLYNTVGIIAGSSTTLSGTAQIIFAVPSEVAPFMLAPRFIISVRELHSRVTGEHIDSGFGLHSQCFSIGGIVFASPEGREGDWSAVEEVVEVVVK
ncbi:hypothetical protein BS17DRAFT_60662 [Gyrodon lividus]|nr:hypothetical protein BS17DRAFT_60662 [Gyrodon lividus]